MMRVAPDDPEKANGFLLSQFLKQVLRQAGRPFTSSIIQLSQNLKGKSWYSNNCRIRRSGVQAPGPASYCVWCAAIAQAIRASLLAKAQATTLEWRRLSNERTQSAKAPFW